MWQPLAIGICSDVFIPKRQMQSVLRSCKLLESTHFQDKQTRIVISLALRLALLETIGA